MKSNATLQWGQSGRTHALSQVSQVQARAVDGRRWGTLHASHRSTASLCASPSIATSPRPRRRISRLGIRDVEGVPCDGAAHHLQQGAATAHRSVASAPPRRGAPSRRSRPQVATSAVVRQQVRDRATTTRPCRVTRDLSGARRAPRRFREAVRGSRRKSTSFKASAALRRNHCGPFRNPCASDRSRSALSIGAPRRACGFESCQVEITGRHSNRQTAQLAAQTPRSRADPTLIQRQVLRPMYAYVREVSCAVGSRPAHDG